MEQFLVPFLVFAAVATVGFVLFGLFSPQISVVQERLQAIAEGGGAGTRGEKAKKKKGSLITRFAGVFGGLAKVIFEGGGGDETPHRLAMAGYISPEYVTNFYGIRLMCGAGAACLASIITLVKGDPPSSIVLFTIVGLLLGLILPNFYLSRLVSARKERIAEALPNMVDMLVVCVEAGLALDMAMSRVGQELRLSSPELSLELNMLGQELAAGQAHEQALTRMAWRIGIDDIENLVSMLIQAERFGTSIAASLRVFSDSFRTARRQRIEEAAAKTTVKLLFPLIFFIFPSIFVILLGPAALSIFAGGVFK